MDYQRPRFKIGMVEILIIINVILFIPYLFHTVSPLAWLVEGLGALNINNKQAYVDLFRQYMNLNITSFYSVNTGAWWQVLSAMFLHGGFAHIFFNMYALFMFGKPLEIRWGKWKFLSFYLSVGIFANIASAVLFLITGNQVVLLGASGAIMGVLLAFGAYNPNAMLLLFFFIPLRVKWAILLYAGIETVSEVFGVKDGIAHMTHLFGFLFGFLYMLVFFRVNAVKEMFFPKKIDYTIQ